MRPLPALRLEMADGVLRALGAHGTMTPAELAVSEPPEVLFKGGGPERPERRVKDLLRYAELVGLARMVDGRAGLTEAGRRYVDAADPVARWTVTPAQSEILRERLRSGHEAGALRGAALTLSLLATAPEDRPVGFQEIGRALGAAGHREGWTSSKTHYHQGARFAGLLRAMALIDGENRLTSAGRAKLEELDVPEHRDWVDIVNSVPETSEEAWIFQANPRYYNIAAAVKSLHKMNWLVAQSQREIKAGHRVYIWQSGADGGVIALGTVLTDPAPSTEQEGDEFVVDQSRFEGEQLRVDLSIDEVLETPLGRELLGEHPVLKSLGILKFANATNFRVKPEEDRALQQLIQSSPGMGLTVWWVNQGSHYREERDGAFVWAPMQSKSGQQLSHWDSLLNAAQGDRIVHYANGRIRAVGEVLEPAVEAPRPAGLSEEAWAQDGRIVKVAYTELPEPIALEDVPNHWRLSQGPPFTSHGSVQQGYFFRLNEDFVARLAARFPQLGLAATPPPPAPEYTEPSFETIHGFVRHKGLVISEQTLRRYHLSLKSRGFVILPGVSGTGKTWLAELYARAVGGEHLLVAVAPDWTSNEDLLGYLNPLTDRFQFTNFTAFIREAAAEYQAAGREERRAKPFHVTLDEMNLARVEHYFARFLSAMEVRARNGTAPVELGGGHEVLLTPNLYFTGTVNIDETTHGFADKVFDRAQLVELEVSARAVHDWLDGQPYQDDLLRVWEAVAAVAPFAFRVLDEIAEYVAEAQLIGVAWEIAIDEQLLQKVLPKIRGTDPRIDDCLRKLVEISEDKYPLTHAKTRAIRDGFLQHQFASYF